MLTHSQSRDVDETTPSLEPGLRSIVFSLLPYLVLLAGIYHVFVIGASGAFVTFRYAENILNGSGPVYNAGEHVEGYTSPLHLILITLIMIPVRGLGIYFKAKLLGVVFALVGLWQLRQLAALAGLGRRAAIFAQWLVVLNVSYACDAVLGLETTLYICTVLGSAIAYIKERDGQAGCWSAVLLFLALLTRPDAALLFVFLFGLSVFDAVKGRTSYKRVAIWAGIYLVLTAIFVALRFGYYGLIVPNTYFAKSVPPETALRTGIVYLLDVLSPSLKSRLWTIFSAAVFWGLAAIGFWQHRRDKHSAVLGLVMADSVAFILKAGGSAGLGWRYVEPSAPILAILQVWGIKAVSQYLSERAPKISMTPVIATAVLAVWCVTFMAVPDMSWDRAHFSTRDSTLFVNGVGSKGKEWADAANLVHSQLPKGVLIAGFDTEYLAYTNPGDRFLDMRGLTDREVASLPSSFKSPIGIRDSHWFDPGDPMYEILMRKHPDYIAEYDRPNLLIAGYRLILEEPIDSRSTSTQVVQIYRSEGSGVDGARGL